MNKRTNQSGSVVAFVIVGVVLASVVVGGVYLVNQRNKEDIANKPSGGTNQPQPSPTPTPSSSTSQGGSRGSSPAPTTSQQQQNTQTSPPTTGVTQNGSLPTSGPADDGLRVLAFGVLIGVSVAFVRSQSRKQQPVSL